jgi:hypothetical protein
MAYLVLVQVTVPTQRGARYSHACRPRALHSPHEHSTRFLMYRVADNLSSAEVCSEA